MNSYCISKKLFLFFFFVSITFASAYAQANEEVIIYVDVDKEENIDFFNEETYGNSWDTAFRSLHDALRFGDPNATQIWIAAGNYYLDDGMGYSSQFDSTPFTSYTNPFVIQNRDVTIYGGFAGTETSLEQRNIQANPTYLDGNVYYKNLRDFTVPDDFYAPANKFSNRILLIRNSTVTLDGLTFQYVTGDNQTHVYKTDEGRGAFITANLSAVTVNNCLFQYGQDGFYGMIVYARNETSPVQINNSVIQKSGGAGRSYFDVDNFSIDRSIFQELGNESDENSIISANNGSNVEFSNSVLYKNTGVRIGSAPAEGDCNLTFRNLLVLNNDLKGRSFFEGDDTFVENLSRSISVINSTFINNAYAACVGLSSTTFFPIDYAVTMQNNVFYGNKTANGGSTISPEITNVVEEDVVSISNNATDKSGSVLLTDTNFNTGAVDLSAITDLTTLFVTPDNPKGVDNEWLTSDDGFVPEKGSTLLIGAGTATGAPTTDIIGATRPAVPSLGAYEGEPVLGSAMIKKIEDSLELYPNPVVKGSTLYINNPNALTVHTIEIHDLTGRLVKTFALEDRNTHIAIDISSLANATYTVRIHNEHGTVSKKIIINN